MNLMINEVKSEIINTIKLLLYKASPNIIEKLEFENDIIYVETLLFSYFNNSKNNSVSNETLEEILQGYFTQKEELKLKNSFNRNGVAYIPQIGFFKRGLTENYEPILIKGDFEIVKEIHPTQEKYFVEFYKGHIINQNPEHNSVWEMHYEELFQAIATIKEHVPEFYKELIFANRKIYLHDNPKIINFTSVETLGMLYFYVIGKTNLIYFIEELIHQGSHNYLYYVVHNRKDFFKIDVDNLLMRDFTKQQWDYRTIYGAFHGVFTVSQRVKYFDVLLTKNIFKGREKHKLLGRFTDQFARFRTGFELLNLEEVFTQKGIAFYNQIDKDCASTLKKYEKLAKEFDLTNRYLDFRYEDFCKLNIYEEFLEKEAKGYFNF